MKKEEKENFTKLTQRGISLIVLIVTIIVIIILAAAVILTLSKNNPVESAREARFKEDIVSMQDELSMYLSSQYAKDLGNFDPSSVSKSGDEMVEILPSTDGYEAKVKVEKGKLKYIGNNEKEKEWSESILGSKVKAEWKETIDDVTEDGVPIPKGFTYVTGTKDTGTVIKDSNGNEFVWVPATESTYVKDLEFPSDCTPTGDDTPAGDNSMVAIFAILAVLAAAGVVTVVVAKRRAIEE